MTQDKSTAPAPKQGRGVPLIEQLDAFLEERERLESKIATAAARRNKKIAKAERRYQQDVGKAPKKLEKLDARLAAFLERHRYWLTRRYSKTIIRPHGEIKDVLRPIELEKPADTSGAVLLLRTRRGGRRFLRITYALDLRNLLTKAPESLRAELRSMGFWWGRHRTISVKSTSSNETKVISRRRYNKRA